jgi:hypothetical protein
MSTWFKHHNAGRIDDNLFYSDNCNTGYARTARANHQLIRGTEIEAPDNETVAHRSVDLGVAL